MAEPASADNDINSDDRRRRPPSFLGAFSLAPNFIRALIPRAISAAAAIQPVRPPSFSVHLFSDSEQLGARRRLMTVTLGPPLPPSPSPPARSRVITGLTRCRGCAAIMPLARARERGREGTEAVKDNGATMSDAAEPQSERSDVARRRTVPELKLRWQSFFPSLLPSFLRGGHSYRARTARTLT